MGFASRYRFAIGLFMAAMSLAGCSLGNCVLSTTVEKERAAPSSISDVPSNVTMRAENGKLLIPAHLIDTNSPNESEIRVTASTKGNTIVVLEEMGNPSYVSSLLSKFRVTETIDTSILPPGEYTVIIMRHSWLVGSKSEGTSGHWVDATILQQQVTIGR